MKEYLQGIVLSSMLILGSQTASIAQVNDELKYCQIEGAASYKPDIEVVRFLLGYNNKRTADSLLKACKEKYSSENKRELYVTDALNYLHSLGWRLVTVYTVVLVNPDFTRYHYVLKKEP